MTTSNQVETYTELVVLQAAGVYEELSEALTAGMEVPWSRDEETEADLHDASYTVFIRNETANRPGVRLFLIPRDNDVQVANIVPVDHGSISMDEYNGTASEFADRFVRPAAEQLGLDTTLTPPNVDLSEELDPEAFEALRLFSAGANKATGSSHPMDRERWFDFLVKHSRSGRDLSTDFLQQWLMNNGWSEQVSFDLILQYETARDLLEYERDH